jgi:hypothetical protein
MFLEELEDLKNQYPDRFHLINVLSREAQDVELFSGRLDRERLERILGVLVPVQTVDEWYLCGPFGMVEGPRGFWPISGSTAPRPPRGVPRRRLRRRPCRQPVPVAARRAV